VKNFFIFVTVPKTTSGNCGLFPPQGLNPLARILYYSCLEGPVLHVLILQFYPPWIMSSFFDR
jgi:hypothetical protein